MMLRRVTSRKRVKAICTAMMLLYLLVAAGQAIKASLPLIDPALSTGHVECGGGGCRIETSPQKLFTSGERQAEALSPGRQAQFTEWLLQPAVRLGLFTSEAIRAGPSIFLFFSLAWASRALARAGGFAETLAWLRRAAAAAVAVVLVQPIADTIRATTVSPFEAGRQQIYFAFNGGPFLWGVLLAGAVWMSVWALEQARLTEIELGKIV